MDANRTQAELELTIDGLIEKVRTHTLHEWLRFCHFCVLGMNFDGEQSLGLTSPARQVYYLLGLAIVHSPRAIAPGTEMLADVDDEERGEVFGSLERIFNLYQMRPYEHTSSLEAEQRNAAALEHLVWMLAFSTHHYQLPLISDEQIRERIDSLVIPFDEELGARLGYGPRDLLQFLERIGDQAQERITRFPKLLAEAHGRFQESGGKPPTAEEREDGRRAFYETALLDIDAALETIPEARRVPLLGALVAPADCDYRYPTEPNPFIAHPVVQTSAAEFGTPFVGMVLMWGWLHFSAILSADPELSPKYFDLRAAFVEDKISDSRRALGIPDQDEARSVYLGTDSKDEHDSVWVVGRSVIVLEGKSAHFREPFRDYDKAAKRIIDDFRSSSGLQGGANQVVRFVRAVRGGQREFYDQRGRPILRLPDQIDDVYGILATQDTWGALGSQAAEFLEDVEDDEFPLIIAAPDLHRFCLSLAKRGHSGPKLVEFLRQRRALAKRLKASDELDVAGVFLCYEDGLETFVQQEADGLILSEGYSQILDNDWREERGYEQIPFEADAEPAMMDLGKVRDEIVSELSSRKTENAGATRQHRRTKIGRNEKCPCASGKKFKKCCGSPTRK